MNELNIYKKFNYKKLLKTTNFYFGQKYKWYNYKTVYAPQNGNYTISFNKYNIRICYWADDTDESKKIKAKLKKFVDDILQKEKTSIFCIGECDILNDLDFVVKIQLK